MNHRGIVQSCIRHREKLPVRGFRDVLLRIRTFAIQVTAGAGNATQGSSIHQCQSPAPSIKDPSLLSAPEPAQEVDRSFRHCWAVPNDSQGPS